MTTAPWWRGAVIYQIYPRSFMDTNGDGIGDLPGIVERMDHVAGLGADAIWISPFFRSPMHDFGYDIADYRDVDPMFGTVADFDALLERAHALGIRVMIDQVLSHTSAEHAWFRESRQSRDNPKADWYVWADARPDGTPPNNWMSIFGGVAWKWEPRRGQYYLHNFLSSQPDLNFHNPEVQQATLDNVEGGLLHLGVVEVQVRLRGQEVVQVVLAAAWLPLPGHAAEDRHPVVGWGAVGAGVGPHVPVGLGVVAALSALAEPRVLGRGVAEHLVDHHPDPERVRALEQGVEVGHGAEHRVDVAVVGDVVAEVVHGRAEERRDPDRVGAQAGDVVHAFDDARQVADAIAVGIHEAARVDLVDHRAAPPGGGRHSDPRRNAAAAAAPVGHYSTAAVRLRWRDRRQCDEYVCKAGAAPAPAPTMARRRRHRGTRTA